MPSMFRVAQLVGEAVHACRAEVAELLEASQLSPSCSMLVGGRVGDGPLALYRIYSEGNFIACMREQPFLQIGETKYGKPILDRALQVDTPLEEVVKVGLISFDSTLRSNLAVGRPLDLVVLPADASAPDRPAPDRQRRRLFQRSLGALVADAQRGARDDPRSALHAGVRPRAASATPTSCLDLPPPDDEKRSGIPDHFRPDEEI